MIRVFRGSGGPDAGNTRLLRQTRDNGSGSRTEDEQRFRGIDAARPHPRRRASVERGLRPAGL